MKRRYLRPTIQRILEAIAFITLMILAMIDDFEICTTSIVIIGTLMAILLVDAMLLMMYGRGIE